MNTFSSLKEKWNSETPKFKNKVSKVLNSANTNSGVMVNPFINKNGSLVNPYLNYQRLLDSPNISAKAKSFIQSATGLIPTSEEILLKNNRTGSADLSRSASIGVVKGTGYKPSVSGGNNIVDSAKRYIGTPYVWGGESMAEGGMDCSGFVYNALKDSGYNVGRTTAQGYRGLGTKVNKSDMQPGDLIFYGKDNNASHIGIYIGNGQMIHSSGGSKNTKSNPGKGVSITNVDYRGDFLEARRY